MSNWSRPSRREALGLGLGALGASAVVSGGIAAAADSPLGPSPDLSIQPDSPADGGSRVEVVAPTELGAEYVSIAGYLFQAGNSNAVYDSSGGELSGTTQGGFFTAELQLPQGATITEVVAFYTKTNIGTMTVRLRGVASGTGTLEEFSTSTTATAPNLNSPQMLVQVPVTPGAAPLGAQPVVVDNTLKSYSVIVNMPTSGTDLEGVRVGFKPAAVAVSLGNLFYPLTPGRVFDSRWPILGGAKILSGENRQISVKDRRRINPDDGAVNLVDFVPAGARAVAFNITATDTVGGGFLATTPGDATAFGASTINWSQPGLSMANAAVVNLDAARTIKVFAGGGGSTHFVIDVLGYYAP